MKTRIVKIELTVCLTSESQKEFESELAWLERDLDETASKVGVVKMMTTEEEDEN